MGEPKDKRRFTSGVRFKALCAVLSYKFFRKSRPLSMTFLTTHKCNFDCQTCDIHKFIQKDIPSERFRQIIREVAAAGAIRVSFTGGGEPLLRDDIGDLIRLSKSLGLIVSLVTNGYFLDRKLEDLRSLDLLLVSYDSTKALKNTSESPLPRILENAILAKKSGIPVVLQPLLTKDTCLNIERFFELSRRHGFVLSLQPLENWYQGSSPENLKPTREELTLAIEKIIAEKKKSHNILNTVRYFRTLQKLWERPLTKGKCYAGIYFASITADGYLYACNPVIKRDPAISVLDQPFEAAWKQLRPPACGGCLWNCHHELNNIFSLDLATIINLLRFSRNRMVYRG
jgi:MoaA/NifB/PqqE/SkfB family radical SAM enzyme